MSIQYIMDRGIITISEAGMVTIPTAPVWMTQFEIADLFGVFSCNIRKAIHATFHIHCLLLLLFLLPQRNI